MNKFVFRILVFLMSLSLIGIILVQVYWFNKAQENSEEQFQFHVKLALGKVAQQLQKNEEYTFYNRYQKVRDSIGKDPDKEDLLEYRYYQRNVRTNETIIYSNSILAENQDIFSSFFDKKNTDSVNVKSFSSKRKTEIYNKPFDNQGMQNTVTPDIVLEKEGTINKIRNVQFEIFMKDIAALQPIQERVSTTQLQKLLRNELKANGINTPFEFNVYSNGLATKVKSESFRYNKYETYSVPIFIDTDGNNQFQLLTTFPQKAKYIFREIVGITLLSVIFTLIIIIAYTNALSQLFRQRQISEIKTDFINNMTHEFKTPIATINLALDAIKNPKVIENKEMVHKYLQMIRDENKRMHAQVENVLRISKLEKRELEIVKDPNNIHDILEEAVEHVGLIIDDREGKITTHFNAKRTTVLLNDVHFTNVFVNILDNAIKYSPEAPVIDIYTENINEFILIKIKDQGAGMSKAAQKRIFEKFYREHTGDIHNVKGHGLGLAYVKRITEDHNGQVSVESEKGKGSTFTIKLPLIN